MRWIIAVIGLFSCTHVTVAQQSPASYEFFSTISDCPASLGGWKCLELDLSSETQEETDTTKRKKFEYSWSMGEGSRKQGDRIEHCYEDFGSYQVKMDLIDPETNTVIRNDLSATAYLFPEIRPAISARNQDNLASSFEFEASHDHPEVFTPDNVYWRIDGKYYEGTNVNHTFHAAGTYLVEMAIVRNTELTGLLTACATKEITVLESDIWTTALVQHFDNERERFRTGPFLKSDVFCLLVSRETPNKPIIIPLRVMMSEDRVKADREYDVLLFSGNLFTNKKELKTHGLKGSDLLTSLKDTVLSFVSEPVHHLKSVVIENKTANLFPDDMIKQAAEVLAMFPSFKIQIGSYIHSGTRAEKGIQSSLQTASQIKQLLISKGIAEDRISIAHPDNNRALFNTCSGSPDCGREDKALDNKVEFKITGVTL
jgi:hypothetical protein